MTRSIICSTAQGAQQHGSRLESEGFCDVT